MRPLIGIALALSLSACGGDDDDDAHADAGGGGPDAGQDAGLPDAAPDAGPDPRFDALAAAVLTDLDAANATGASVAVWLDGEVVWVGGFGTDAIDEDSLFMIGSDTKKLTALGCLQRVEAGGLALDTTIAEVLPDLDMRRAPRFLGATLHDLISHQGGIVDGVEETRDTDDDALRAFAYGAFADGYYPLAPPGRIWNYSNPNFSIAGLLDETVAGRPWADVVEDDLFAPLGMTRTVARKSEVDADHVTGMGFDASDDRTVDRVPLEDTWESAFVRPAGHVWSTPSDQMRLAAFLVDGDPEVLRDDLREAVSTAQVPLFPDLPGAYGYGLFVGRGLSIYDDWYDVPVWSHGGNTWTHTSTFYILPEQRFAISILSNGFGDDFTASVVTAFQTLVDLPAPGVETPAPFDPDALDDLSGSYFDDFNAGELVIRREGDALRLDAPTLDRYGIPYEHAMTHLSTRVWLANIQGSDLDFAFIDGPDGETYFRNRAIVAIRPGPDIGPRHAPRRAPEEARIRAALRQARRDAIPSLIFH